WRCSACPPKIEHEIACDLQRQSRAVVFFHQRKGEVHSGRNTGRRIDIFVADKYWIGIDTGARRARDQNLAPVPVRCSPAAIKQTGSRQQHGSSADGADSPNSSSDGFQPAADFRTYFIILNRAAAGYEQGVDVSAQFAKSFVRHDSQTAIRDK